MTDIDWSGLEWLHEDISRVDDGCAAPPRSVVRLSQVAHPLFDPHVPDWMDRAACARTPYEDLWFPRSKPKQAALHICEMCPVKTECIEYADAMTDAGRNPDGVWGGLTHAQRNERRRERQQRDRRADHQPSTRD